MKTLPERKSIIQRFEKKFQLIHVLILLCFISSVTYGQDVREVIDNTIDILDKKHFKLSDTVSNELKLRNYLKTLRRQEEINRKPKGEFDFGFTIRNSENKNLSEFSMGAKFTSGSYPGEFKFVSSIDVRLEDDELVEQLSNLFTSYDHYLSRSLEWEGYGFIRRTSNDYLNIKQRYEAGTGVVWNALYSGNRYKKENKKKNEKGACLTEDGKKLYDKLENATKEYCSLFNSECLDYSNDTNCLDSCNYKMGKEIEMEKNDKEILTKSYNRSINSIIKNNSGFRVSFLAGLNYEVETTSDSVILFNGDEEFIKMNFKPKELFRLALAPIVEFKIGLFELETRVYYKLGVFITDLYKDEVSSDDKEVENVRINYRIEWPTTISFKFSEKVSLKYEIYYVYINAPRRSFKYEPGGEPVYPLYVASNQFVMAKVGLNFKL